MPGATTAVESGFPSPRIPRLRLQSVASPFGGAGREKGCSKTHKPSVLAFRERNVKVGTVPAWKQAVEFMIGEQVNDPADQHLNEMRLNRGAWEKKALLRRIYRRFYRLIAEQLTPDSGAKTVELGS